MDCNDDKPRHAFATPRREAPESLMNLSPQKTEGVGNAGCLLHPQPPVQGRKHRGRSHRYTGITRHSRTQWF